MNQTQSEAAEQTAVSSEWWTSHRTKVASICGLLGGLGMLGITSVVVGAARPGPGLGVGGLFYPLAHVLGAVALLAANGQYGFRYGRRGRSIALVVVLSMAVYAGMMILLSSMGPALLGDLLVPIGVLTGTAYMSIRIFGSIFGLYLWQQAVEQHSTTRLTAGFFISLLPAVFVLPVLMQFSVPGWVLNAPLGLGCIALSYDLWRAQRDRSGQRMRKSS